MADLTPTDTAPPRETLSSLAADRRSFLRRAALVGIPVVIATVPSRTVWAGSKSRNNAAQIDATGGGQTSLSPSASANQLNSLL